MVNPHNKHGKALFEVFPQLSVEVNSVHFQYFRNLTMSWKKASAEVGLAGLNPLEVARGAMFLPVFQDMPNPLNPQPVEITTPEEIPLVSVSLNIF